jgi:uncharacterized repeat protein (TIGR03803 family)
MFEKRLATYLGLATLAVLSVLLITRPAQAQTETVLHSFTGGSDGANPLSHLTSDGKGNFYGTTTRGGLGYGTAFELSPNSNGGWNETVLYSFKGEADGEAPYSDLVFDGLGNIYGTTPLGGANWLGVVFELTPVGGSWTETVLYSFKGGTDGASPISGLIFDKAGNLYGTTLYGGVDESGTVFELSPSPDGWTEQVIYTSQGTQYGNAGLTMDTAGNIFGVTSTTVFELSPDGKGGWTPTVIHTFPSSPKDGYWAGGTPLLDQVGNLYGTTFNGGTRNCGTVYKLRPGKKGKWRENILHSFRCGPDLGNKDGSGPFAGIVFDANGNIYGTTGAGGKSGFGTVFELKAAVGKGSFTERVLWSFNGTDGSQPQASLILDSTGDLYGTTADTTNGYGVVFEVTPRR